MILAASRVVTSEAVHEPGWIETSNGEVSGGEASDGRILAAGAGRPARIDRDLGEATIVPGFVDLHVHGGGGGSYAGADRESALRARAAHLAHGTTTTMASLVTDSPEALLDNVRMLTGLVADGSVRGIHLEGPWLSPGRAGAHDREMLRAPDFAEIERLLEAGGGAIRMVTIAPELPGALAAIRRFVETGAVVAVGHTDADYTRTRGAIEAGATVATHLFNAMAPLHHRDPGPVAALMEDPRVTVELVADGVHLHGATAALVRSAVGPDRIALVTDAMDAAGCADGAYRLGPLDVEVSGGTARLSGTETIAGGTATMGDMFAAGLRLGGGPIAGEALRDAVRVTATTPARALGWDDVGDIAVGKRADLVVLDTELRVAGVYVGGVPVDGVIAGGGEPASS